VHYQALLVLKNAITRSFQACKLCTNTTPQAMWPPLLFYFPLPHLLESPGTMSESNEEYLQVHTHTGVRGNLVVILLLGLKVGPMSCWNAPPYGCHKQLLYWVV